jgi:uncharacterized protein YebE (UPF0316 family)
MVYKTILIMEFLNTPLFDYVMLPLFIFFMRICDVTLDTMRIILMTKGYRKLAPVIGFFEVLIWIIAISRIMRNLDNWAGYVGYAGGFATGNFVGMWLDEKLAIGHEIIRVITKKDANQLADVLRKAGFGVTTVKATGMQGEVGVLYIIVNRRNIKQVISLIQLHNPNAFFTIESIHYVNRQLDTRVATERLGSRFFPFVRH